ncbi:hypothetical protein [Spirosoma sp. KNUC1025]|uniref:hypothetical protein n=1 Tax=Spirosoma sp. KNUC1025 TaxID=2894082 RepID=UPI00386DA7FA|nr:hypothetical protein LN737_07750 [Spirosoma sp. KNUC1025]
MKWLVFNTIALCTLISTLSDLSYEDANKINFIYPRQEGRSPILPPISSNWVATDGLGRTLPSYAATGGFKNNKYVGIFYFLWHGQYNDKAVYDISSITKSNPTNPKFGPEGAFHWWGEPEVGYFKADDPWVIRRNLQLLTLAGVDILFFDATNADPYLAIVNKLCKISVEMRHAGIPTPYICFVTYSKSAQTVTNVYEQFYAQNRYSELWFRWQGKPLILGKIEEMTNSAIRNFFTWRYSWAWTNSRNEPHHWQWLDRTPQNYGWDKDHTVPEEIPVAVASHPWDNNVGKSFHQGQAGVLNRQGTTSLTNQGRYFEEQWKRALQVNPSVVFVTGWNEWIAQRFVNSQTDSAAKAHPALFMGKPLKPKQTFFIDLYNQEYNRDIDPMKGGYTDNYYYQLVTNIRRYKGMSPPEEVSPPTTITIDGQFNDWTNLKPSFNDPSGDVMHRDWPRADNKINYTNTTGRNDIVLCRIARDNKKVYFYVKTATKLTSSTDKNWMLLFIDTDQFIETGWAGYDFLINKTIKDNKSTISHWNGKSWTLVSSAFIKYTDDELELSVPLNAINQQPGKINFDFHWADNIQQFDDITEFFLNGDSAPDRRFNYRYGVKSFSNK